MNEFVFDDIEPVAQEPKEKPTQVTVMPPMIHVTKLTPEIVTLLGQLMELAQK